MAAGLPISIKKIEVMAAYELPSLIAINLSSLEIRSLATSSTELHR
jgi:hypothetical protein